jgi:hypothetical protein
MKSLLIVLTSIILFVSYVSSVCLMLLGSLLLIDNI